MTAFSSRRILAAITLSGTFLFSPAQAWGPEGHKVVGALAIDQLSKPARNTFLGIMGTRDLDDLTDWCNWPDAYRSTDEGAWSEPLHYINMVPGASMYERERDCPDGKCVTEAIGFYAEQLGDSDLDNDKRREAFGWVCHFVGDLHQPLHAGFGHDRGGNDFDIRYGGEDLNLHTFWDHTLIEQNSDSWNSLYGQLRDESASPVNGVWGKEDAVSWTNESHDFASRHSYPEQPVITAEFASRSWGSVQSQLRKGGRRLAQVVNTVLTRNCENSDE